jgi:hypothetical protein
MGKSKPLIIIGNAFERERQHSKQAPLRVMWTRQELGDLLNIYGRHVAAGQWRDYAIDDGTETAVFSIFRRSSEVPLYCIDKTPALRRKQGQYCLRGAAGQILRRGHDLPALLKFFERKQMRLID